MLGLDWGKLESCCPVKVLSVDGLRPFVDVDTLTKRYCRLKSDSLRGQSCRGKIPGRLDFFIESVLIPHSRIATSPDIKLVRCYDGKTTQITLSRYAMRSVIYDAIMTYYRDVN